MRSPIQTVKGAEVIILKQLGFVKSKTFNLLGYFFSMLIFLKVQAAFSLSVLFSTIIYYYVYESGNLANTDKLYFLSLLL